MWPAVCFLQPLFGDFWLLPASEKVMLRVESYATIMFLVWFWEKAISCDGLRLILEMSLEMATISQANCISILSEVGFFSANGSVLF